jgi:hypothetical protein
MVIKQSDCTNPMAFFGDVENFVSCTQHIEFTKGLKDAADMFEGR